MEHRTKAVRRSAWIVAACVLVAIAIVSLITLKLLGYASCILDHVETAAVEQMPDHHGFRIGSLEWDVEGYARDARLLPFRQLFRRHCAGKNGLDAAMCVSDAFAAAFPFGAEIHDFCDRNYDPARALALHMGGHPGHCMQRSGLLAAVLLSAGIPARVAQLIPLHSKGHTVVEVWDRRYGWVILDPSAGAEIGTAAGPASAMEITVSHRLPVIWGPGRPDLPSAASIYAPERESFFDGNILYPEPWLYLRTGTRVSSWPYRGKYAVAGPMNWRLGRMQSICRALAVFSALAALFCGSVPRLAAVRRKQPFSDSMSVPANVALDV